MIAHARPSCPRYSRHVFFAGFVDREDWRRGAKMMLLADMGEDDALWAKLLQKYGSAGDGVVYLDRLADYVPLDPRLALMMKAMVASVAGVTEKLERAQRRHESQSQTRANRVILNMRRAILAPVYAAWAELVQKRQRLGRKALRAAMNSGLSKGWNQWCGVARDAAAAKAKMAKVARRLKNRDLSRAWNHWAGWRAEVQRLRAFARRLANQGLSRGINRWEEAHEERRARARAARRGLARLVHREILGCWLVWTGVTARLSANAAKMRKLLRRWVHRSVSAGFNAWTELVRQARVLARAARKARHASAGRAYRRWAEMAEERIRLRGVAERVMRRMLNALAAGVFDGWYEAVRSLVETREARLRHAVVQMTMSGAARCFVAWAALCVGSGASRERLMRSVLGRIQSRALSLCLTAWVEWHTEAMRVRSYYAARWLNGLLSKTFVAWAALAARDARLRERCRAIAVRIARRTEVVVLQEWHRYVGEARSYMRAALARWLNEALNAALEAWHRYAAEARRFQRLGRLVLGRYTNALCAKVLLAWAGLASGEGERRRQSTQQALAFLSGRNDLILRQRFEAWVRAIRAAKREREQTTRGVLVRVRNRLVAMAWNRWLELHYEMAKVRHAASRWEHSASGAAWRTWAAYAYDRRRMVELGRLMVGRWRHGLLSRVLIYWSHHVRTVRDDREEKTLRALAMLSDKRAVALLYFLRRWQAWFAEHAGRKVGLIGKAIGRYHHQLCAKCFLGWGVYTMHARKEGDEKRLKALAFLSGRASVVLKAAFYALRRAIAERQDEREMLVQKSLMRFKYGLLHLAFETWVTLVREAARLKGMMSQIHPEVAKLRGRLVHLEETVEARLSEPEPPPDCPPWDGALVDTVDLAPLVASVSGVASAMGSVLGAMRHLTEALSETRLATELSGVAAGGAIGGGGGAIGGGGRRRRRNRDGGDWRRWRRRGGRCRRQWWRLRKRRRWRERRGADGRRLWRWRRLRRPSRRCDVGPRCPRVCAGAALRARGDALRRHRRGGAQAARGGGGAPRRHPSERGGRRTAGGHTQPPRARAAQGAALPAADRRRRRRGGRLAQDADA